MASTSRAKRPLGQRNIISREQVLAVAIDLISRKGTAGCTMADTARALDVSVMALYTYFPSRDALIEAAAKQVFASLSSPEEGDDWRDA